MSRNIFQSIRMKLLLMAFLSILFTILSDMIIWIIVKYMQFRVRMPVGSAYSVRQLMRDMRAPFHGFTPVASVLFITITVLLYLGYFIAFTIPIVDYIREVMRGLDRIKMGDYSTEVPVRQNTELTDMAVTINTIQVGIDRTERDRAEAERVKDELITNVAHDLRSPLTSVIGYLDLLRTAKKLDSETKENYIKIAYEKALRMQNLVTDLFDFTRYGKDKVEADKHTIDAVQLMEQIVDEFYPMLRENELECYNVFPKEKVYIDGDGELLARAFGNLMKNAVTYGAEGKQIRVEIQNLSQKNQVRIAVINYGRIIPKRDIKHLFDKFYRGDMARHTSGGTGLGLAIAKNIFDMHNASIFVRSDEQGTVFEVLFPLDKHKTMTTDLRPS